MTTLCRWTWRANTLDHHRALTDSPTQRLGLCLLGTLCLCCTGLANGCSWCCKGINGCCSWCCGALADGRSTAQGSADKRRTRSSVPLAKGCEGVKGSNTTLDLPTNPSGHRSTAQAADGAPSDDSCCCCCSGMQCVRCCVCAPASAANSGYAYWMYSQGSSVRNYTGSLIVKQVRDEGYWWLYSNLHQGVHRRLAEGWMPYKPHASSSAGSRQLLSVAARSPLAHQL